MVRNFTLIYWADEGWQVGRLKEVPGVFSQGKTLKELESNIRDAYRLMMEDAAEGLPKNVTRMTEVELTV
jgi:predicted RNase H-like HicB family nuclease